MGPFFPYWWKYEDLYLVIKCKSILKGWEVQLVSSSHVVYSFQGCSLRSLCSDTHSVEFGLEPWFFFLINIKWKHWLHLPTCPFCRGVGLPGGSLFLFLFLSLSTWPWRKEVCSFFTYMESTVSVKWRTSDSIPVLSLSFADKGPNMNNSCSCMYINCTPNLWARKQILLHWSF